MQRWATYFHDGAGYVQGDAATRHADGSFTFHGRSDDVFIVCGQRVGVEEIENAILHAREGIRPHVRSCAVVGLADELHGTSVAAFLELDGVTSLSPAEKQLITAVVQEQVGTAGVPSQFVTCSALPMTHSGKVLRRVLRSLLLDGDLDDALGSLSNPGCIEPLRKAVAQSRRDALPQESTLKRRLADVPPEQHESYLQALVLQSVGNLGASTAPLSADTPVLEAGISSMEAASPEKSWFAIRGRAYSRCMVHNWGDSL